MRPFCGRTGQSLLSHANGTLPASPSLQQPTTEGLHLFLSTLSSAHTPLIIPRLWGAGKPPFVSFTPLTQGASRQQFKPVWTLICLWGKKTNKKNGSWPKSFISPCRGAPLSVRFSRSLSPSLSLCPAAPVIRPSGREVGRDRAAATTEWAL